MKQKFLIVLGLISIILGNSVSTMSAQTTFQPVPISKEGLYRTTSKSGTIIQSVRAEPLERNSNQPRQLVGKLWGIAQANFPSWSAGVWVASISYLDSTTNNPFTISAYMSSIVIDGQSNPIHNSPAQVQTNLANVQAKWEGGYPTGCTINNASGTGKNLSISTYHKSVKIQDPSKKTEFPNGLSVPFGCLIGPF